MNAHSSCFIDEHCRVGSTSSCPAAAATARRELARQGEWSSLELRRDRHYLDGEPIHCGETLELQAIGFLGDDYGEYRHVFQRGTRVRYETDFHRGPKLDDRVVLYISVEGYTFTTRLDSGMRFRWPVQR